MNPYINYTTALLSAVFLSLIGCSLPKIVVLKDPLTAEEHLKLGLSYEREGLINQAVKHYKEASKSDARGFLLLGNLYYNLGEYIEAEENYKRAIKTDSKLADAYNNLAWLYFIKGDRIDEAENLVMMAIELEGENQEKIKIYRDTLDKIRKLKNRRS